MYMHRGSGFLKNILKFKTKKCGCHYMSNLKNIKCFGWLLGRLENIATQVGNQY